MNPTLEELIVACAYLMRHKILPPQAVSELIQSKVDETAKYPGKLVKPTTDEVNQCEGEGRQPRR